LLPVTPPEQNEDALFERAQAAEEIGDRAEAERLYRGLMKSDPIDAAPPFNLGNMLQADGRKVEAEAAFRAATRADPMFAEAWYNLSDLLDEQGRAEAAIDCLRRALHAAPEYVDAMFNLALLLQRSNRHNEAAEYWRRYLVNDGQSEWAARARRSLKFCEMQALLTVMASRARVRALWGLSGWRGNERIGLSTGPKTTAGRAKIAEAQRRRWSAFRAARGKPPR
jgi:tetratricopeptide (TPR) repeat protein